LSRPSAVTATADGAGACNCVSPACHRAPIVALWPIYERRDRYDCLIYRRPGRPDAGRTVAARIKRILTLLNARERSRLVPVFKWNDRFSFHSPRYFTSGNTIRHCPALSAVFAVLFSPGPAIVHLSISLANASKRLIMRCGASATRIRCCDRNHPPEGAERHSLAHKTRILYSTNVRLLI
jgi:hypothetical protein